MKLNRTKAILSLLFVIIACSVLLISVLFFKESAFCWFALCLLILSLFLRYYYMCCPHCRRRGIWRSIFSANPFAENAGYCTFCGKLVEYDR